MPDVADQDRIRLPLSRRVEKVTVRSGRTMLRVSKSRRRWSRRRMRRAWTPPAVTRFHAAIAQEQSAAGDRSFFPEGAPEGQLFG